MASRRVRTRAKATTSSPNYGTIHAGSNRSILTLGRWFGFLLMNVGEMGNFISYAFAPASVVAPLGTVCGPLDIFAVHQLAKACFPVRANCKLYIRATDAQGAVPEG